MDPTQGDIDAQDWKQDEPTYSQKPWHRKVVRGESRPRQERAFVDDAHSRRVLTQCDSVTDVVELNVAFKPPSQIFKTPTHRSLSRTRSMRNSDFQPQLRNHTVIELASKQKNEFTLNYPVFDMSRPTDLDQGQGQAEEEEGRTDEPSHFSKYLTDQGAAFDLPAPSYTSTKKVLGDYEDRDLLAQTERIRSGSWE